MERVRPAASLFLTAGTPYDSLEPTLSASQNPRTHFGIRRGVVRKTPSFVITKIRDFRTTPGLCRALMKGQTPTDTPATAATDDLCCGGTLGVFGCHWFYASPGRDERGRNYIRHRSFRWLHARNHGEATGHRARGTSLLLLGDRLEILFMADAIYLFGNSTTASLTRCIVQLGIAVVHR